MHTWLSCGSEQDYKSMQEIGPCLVTSMFKPCPKNISCLSVHKLGITYVNFSYLDDWIRLFVPFTLAWGYGNIFYEAVHTCFLVLLLPFTLPEDMESYSREHYVSVSCFSVATFLSTWWLLCFLRIHKWITVNVHTVRCICIVFSLYLEGFYAYVYAPVHLALWAL
jgi:hypothetical protein